MTAVVHALFEGRYPVEDGYRPFDLLAGEARADLSAYLARMGRRMETPPRVGLGADGAVHVRVATAPAPPAPSGAPGLVSRSIPARPKGGRTRHWAHLVAANHAATRRVSLVPGVVECPADGCWHVAGDRGGLCRACRDQARRARRA